jgi:hypothetical protein
MILCGENLFDKNQHKFGIFILPRTKKPKKVWILKVGSHLAASPARKQELCSKWFKI